ncbi:WAP four-disulfide core domain protein 5-like [Penaeus japonicus]|uniref:WAP four-disulfide core domain protein 5-like n=1 Tax=Penaeus japonicus TaxID=27405 RepID=UPI001C70E95B|nr:WAP four-disulfide core domain protein 5-like [Penaeus japonicus]XP_042891259.1 WAP four-disulfide core domain protein 5-like [Penaeus japonicus]
MVSIKELVIVAVLVAAVAVPPANASPRRFDRPGTCPNTDGIFGICAITEANCSLDSECGRGQKCCPYGCGRECLTAE